MHTGKKYNIISDKKSSSNSIERVLEKHFNYVGIERIESKVIADICIAIGNVKIEKGIKLILPSCITVSIKTGNIDNKFQLLDDMLYNHYNFSMVIEGENIILIDPLGNLWYSGSDIDYSIKVLLRKIIQHGSLKRIGTMRLDIKNPTEWIESNRLIYNKEQEIFINEKVKTFADTFYSFFEVTENTKRFLGNSSFRCIRGGFPSFRSDKDPSFISVSPRNSDKRSIGLEDMILIYPNTSLFSKNPSRIGYINPDGTNSKPSVDTPIQLMLYERFRWINFILHGHCYIKNVPYTKTVYPCGCIDEYGEIAKLIPEMGRNDIGFSVNLKGHGCICMGRNTSYFDTLKFIPKPIFEKQDFIL